MQQQEFLIGGRWAAPATTGTITVRSAATWEVIGSAPEGSEADIDAAVSAARDAFDDPHGWSHWSHSARADALGRLATALEERSEEMARRVTMQNGMPILFATVIEGAGPACFLGTRVLAPATRYEEVVEAFCAIARTAPVGDPLDPEVQVGPLASERQRDRVEGYIAVGSSEGARLVAGGGRPDDLERGWFVRPTVFADVDNRSRIAQEEIFGPVLSIIRYDGDDDAVRIANDSDYGLAGSVWSADEDRALAVARQVQTGTIGLNHYAPNMGAPFGGVKASGQGREYSPEAVSHYQSLQTVYRR